MLFIMVESYIILSVAIPIITILTGFIVKLHINRCHSICCDSDCSKTPIIIETPPNTPINIPPSTPIIHKKELTTLTSSTSI